MLGGNACKGLVNEAIDKLSPNNYNNNHLSYLIFTFWGKILIIRRLFGSRPRI